MVLEWIWTWNRLSTVVGNVCSKLNYWKTSSQSAGVDEAYMMVSNFWLMPWIGVLLGKIVVPKLVKKLPYLYEPPCYYHAHNGKSETNPVHTVPSCASRRTGVHRFFKRKQGATSEFWALPDKVTWMKVHTEDPQISGITVQNLVVWGTLRPGFMHLWFKFYCNNYVPSDPYFFKVLFPAEFRSKILYIFLISTMRAVCLASS